MRGIGGVVSAAALGWMAFGSVMLGCGGREISRATCDDDADCAAGERCQRSRAPGESPQIKPPPCLYEPCTGAGDCGVGSVCGPPPDSAFRSQCGPTACVAPCTEGSCGSGWICRDTGVCEILPCDEPGGLLCPEHWSCAPDSSERMKQSTPATGSVAADPLDFRDLALAGCVRKTCAEEGGYTCLDFYDCEPSTTLNPAGCTAIPCATSGHCSNDHFICAPTSTAPRNIGTDPFGCVLKNCDEGADCSYLSPRPGAAYCNPSAPDATIGGCAFHSCLEGDYCHANETCLPGHAGADAVGCILTSDLGGGTGGTATGGTGGTSNATGGSATGGTGQDFGPGRCVPR